MKDREKRLSGVYQQLSVQFADLHDTPGRMAATGAVRKVRLVIHPCEQNTLCKALHKSVRLHTR
jgi:Carboxyl transferase domain